MSCPSISTLSALLRVNAAAAGVANKGTVLLSTGGAGTFLNGAIGLSMQMINTFTGDGLTVVEIAWDEPGIWGGPQPRTLACRYATAARWVYDNLHSRGNALFAAQGTSGGSSQIAFALTYYGLDGIIGLANLGGGPPGCPLCSPDGVHSLEPLLPNPRPVGIDVRLAYPSTAVRFFLGELEPTANIITDAHAYYDAITSGNTSFTVVPLTAHDIEQTQAGVDAYVQSVRTELKGR